MLVRISRSCAKLRANPISFRVTLAEARSPIFPSGCCGNEGNVTASKIATAVAELPDPDGRTRQRKKILLKKIKKVFYYFLSGRIPTWRIVSGVFFAAF